MADSAGGHAGIFKHGRRLLIRDEEEVPQGKARAAEARDQGEK